MFRNIHSVIAVTRESACENIRKTVIPGRAHRPRARDPWNRCVAIYKTRRVHSFRACPDGHPGM